MAGASEENIQDVKTLAQFILQWSKFLKASDYDFDTFKKEATEAHQFIASKMGG